jgi:hypothetical protein
MMSSSTNGDRAWAAARVERVWGADDGERRT